MSRHTRSKRNRQSRSAEVTGASPCGGVGRRCGGGVGVRLGPAGRGADRPTPIELDVILDPIINAIAESLGGVVDPLAGIDPSAVADLGALGAGCRSMSASTSGLGLSGA